MHQSKKFVKWVRKNDSWSELSWSELSESEHSESEHAHEFSILDIHNYWYESV